MAGTIPLSMTQQFDPLGNPLSGGLLYFFVAGTVSTPQNAFKDLSLTLPHPNPITLDAAGRVPQLFFADGLIKIRLTDSAGVVQLATDNVQVIGASSGGGGGGAVDATTVAQTGDVKHRYGTGIHTGWVRCNGRTIGGSLSSATELADPSAQALFIYLWGADGNLAVSGGRGSTGLADFNAGKQLSLPDARGYTLAGLDDMGNTAAGVLSSYFGAGTTLGAHGGVQYHTLTAAQQASMSGSCSVTVSVSVSGTTAGSNQDINHTHSFAEHGSLAGGFGGGGFNVGGPFGYADLGRETAGPTGTDLNAHTHSFSASGSGSGGGSASVTGGGQAHPNVQPTMVVTLYIKL